MDISETEIQHLKDDVSNHKNHISSLQKNKSELELSLQEMRNQNIALESELKETKDNRDFLNAFIERTSKEHQESKDALNKIIEDLKAGNLIRSFPF